MVADIKIKDTSIEVQRFFKKFQRDMPGIIKESLARASAYGSLRIEERTLQGKDADGNRFRPYAKQTIENRKKAGRKTSFVDLFFSGKMLGSLTFRSSASKGQIFFRRQEEGEKAFFHDTGSGRIPRRPFFAIGRKEEEKIKKIFFDNISRRTARR
jgi:hypothetical protein